MAVRRLVREYFVSVRKQLKQVEMPWPNFSLLVCNARE
jgi:hypothetical protein